MYLVRRMVAGCECHRGRLQIGARQFHSLRQLRRALVQALVRVPARTGAPAPDRRGGPAAPALGCHGAAALIRQPLLQSSQCLASRRCAFLCFAVVELAIVRRTRATHSAGIRHALHRGACDGSNVANMGAPKIWAVRFHYRGFLSSSPPRHVCSPTAAGPHPNRSPLQGDMQ